MTLKKLLKLIAIIHNSHGGIKLQGCDLFAVDDELHLTLNSCDYDLHRALLKAGFVEPTVRELSDYIYRPKRRGPHRAPATLEHHPNVVPLRRPDKR